VAYPEVNFLKEGYFYHFNADQAVKLLEMFALNHKHRKTSRGSDGGEDVQLKTTFRYCSNLWNLYHRYQHQRLIKDSDGAVGEFSVANFKGLNEYAPHIRKMLESVGKERLQNNNLVDTIKHAQEHISDVHAVAIVRYLYGQGTVATRQKMVHFLFLINFHRRSGRESCMISRECLSFGTFRNHNVCLVSDSMEHKGKNFDHRLAYIKRADVMIVCPFTVKWLKWLVENVKHCSDKLLFHKPCHPNSKVDSVLPGAEIFSQEPVPLSTMTKWVGEGCVNVRNHCRSHSLGADIDDALRLIMHKQHAGTAMRKHAETAMEHIGVWSWNFRSCVPPPVRQRSKLG